MTKRSLVLAGFLSTLLSVNALAQGGPFSSQLENFWRLISSGGRTFSNLKATNVTVTGTCTGCGGGGLGTVTSVGWTGGLVSVANPTTTPAFTVAGTSGGIPYFSGAATWASSGVLAASNLLLGGGAGSAPTALVANATAKVPAGGQLLMNTVNTHPSIIIIDDGNGSGALLFGQQNGNAYTFFTANGFFATARSVVISGSAAATYNTTTGIVSGYTTGASPLAADMFDVTTDIPGPSIGSYSLAASSYHMQALDHSANYVYSIEDNGDLHWGAGASHAAEDVALGRASAGVLSLKTGTMLDLPAAGLTVGTGVLSLANNLTTSGNFAVTLTATGTTSVTLPTSGTLTTGGPYCATGGCTFTAVTSILVPTNDGTVVSIGPVAGTTTGFYFPSTSTWRVELSGADILRTSISGGRGVIDWRQADYYQQGSGLISGSAPTISSGFGSSPSVTTSNGAATFRINVGTGGSASTGVIAMPNFPNNNWNCVFNDITTPGVNETKQTGGIGTTVNVTNYNTTTGMAAAWSSGDVITAHCFGE